MSESDICFMTATEMVQRIRARELSCRDVMQAHLTRIDQINPKVNAIVTQVPAERLLAAADAADKALARGDSDGTIARSAHRP